MSAAIRFENQSIARMESRHMRIKVGHSYIACDNFNFLWSREEVKAFRELWREGYSIQEMARYFKRQEEEIALLVLDQASKGNIEKRKGGLFGGFS